MKKFTILIFAVVIIGCYQKGKKQDAASNNLYYDKAIEYRDNQNQDSAFLYFSKVTTYNTDSPLIAKAYANMAIIQCDQGDYFGSEESAIKAINYFQNDNKYLPGVYNSIAIAKNNLKNYKDALYWYSKAVSVSTDSLNILLYQNNITVALIDQKDYKSAIKILQKLLINNTIRNNKSKFAQVLDNLTWAKWLQNPAYNAKPGLMHSLRIREKENDLWGQNASYAHLADYYENQNLDTALFYANKMYEVSKQINSPDDQLQALQKLIKFSPTQLTKKYFGIYHNLNDSLQTARNAAKNQFALIRYETERHKADILKLQKENTDKKYQISVLIFSILLLSVTGFIWYKKRKQRLEMETQNTIRESQLKTSKKVHDVVANGLYRIMSKLENQQSEDHTLIDEMEALYEKSRDISYEQLEYTDKNFNEKISNLLKSFATENTKVLIVGNTTDLWKKVDATIKYEIEHILQELMVNMKKHSKATNVVIRFENHHNAVHINYADNGIGISKQTKFKNGLNNTGNRIKSIGGVINFNLGVEKGLKIQLSFPRL
ncbi:tetratricopeptide repeat-containing sensor histidine kinase [Pedobacter montanisoli]|uniref:ATP-binding protein n=1 Tax=Pedobacter montanisoli TaxID=2923277 RepID=A0ABT0A013_9SPHI|nr:ATP-binding protein [Pedobacter montanisoli]MCJ0743882.1 ATP-binding protein [Pedobacter montanisoli]